MNSTLLSNFMVEADTLEISYDELRKRQKLLGKVTNHFSKSFLNY